MKQIISQSATVVLSVSAALANLCSVFVVGTNRYDMEASVTSPSGVTEVCDIEDLGASQYSIKFIPKEMGIHTVSVKHRGMHIPGPWSLSVSYWLPITPPFVTPVAVILCNLGSFSTGLVLNPQQGPEWCLTGVEKTLKNFN